MIAIILAALSPMPSPLPVPLDHQATCRAYTSDGSGHDVKVSLEFERNNERSGHWWKINGDPRVFPTNDTFRNMFTYHEGGYKGSTVAFSVADQFYIYDLDFDVNVVDQQYSYGAVGNIKLYRRGNMAPSNANMPIAIGFCKIETTKADVK